MEVLTIDETKPSINNILMMHSYHKKFDNLATKVAGIDAYDCANTRVVFHRAVVESDEMISLFTYRLFREGIRCGIFVTPILIHNGFKDNQSVYDSIERHLAQYGVPVVIGYFPEDNDYDISLFSYDNMNLEDI